MAGPDWDTHDAGNASFPGPAGLAALASPQHRRPRRVSRLSACLVLKLELVLVPHPPQPEPLGRLPRPVLGHPPEELLPQRMASRTPDRLRQSRPVEACGERARRSGTFNTVPLAILRRGLFRATAILNREDSRIRVGFFTFSGEFFAAMDSHAQPREY